MNKYRNLAVYVSTHEQGRNVQEKLFNEGFTWWNSTLTYLQLDYIPHAVLFTDDKGDISYSSVAFYETDMSDLYKTNTNLSYDEFMAFDNKGLPSPTRAALPVPPCKPANKIMKEFTPMKAMSLYATNLSMLYKSIAKIGGDPTVVLDKHQELLETFALNGLEISFTIHSDTGDS